MAESDGSSELKTRSSRGVGFRLLRFGVLAVGCALLVALLLPAIIRANATGDRIRCAGNLKQVVSAWNLYHNEHSSTVPATLLSLSNALSHPEILVCPSDKWRRTLKTWAEVLAKGSSYEANMPPNQAMPLDHAQNYVLVRCSIHGNVALADGSVHIASPNFRTNFFQSVTNGK